MTTRAFGSSDPGRTSPWRLVPGHRPVGSSDAPHVDEDRPLTAPQLAAGTLVVAWTALAGPIARAVTLPKAMPVSIIGATVVALVVIVRSKRSSWPLRLVAAAAMGSVGGLTHSTPHGEEGLLVGAWLAVGLLLGAWVGLRKPPLGALPQAGPGATGPVVVLTGVAAWQGNRGGPLWHAALPFALALAAPMVARIGGRGLDRVARRVGATAATAVSNVVFTLLGLVVLVLPWTFQRLVRLDPLHPRAGWSERERRPVQAPQPWATDPAAHRSLHRSALRYSVVLACLVGGAAFLVASRPGPAEERRTPLLPDEETAVDASWYEEYREDIEWVLDERVALRPFEIYRVLDVETRHVNVHDGYRDTWAPPECPSCPRATLWLYGGSAAFGLEQRDEHTIASELSRVAAEHGIQLEVRNRGVPGQLHWRNALRFAWDLTTEERSPDLVVFYEGAEDLLAAVHLAEKGRDDVRAPYDPYVEDLYDEIFEVGETPPPPEGVEYLGWPTATDLGGEDVGLLAVTRYDRSRELSTITAESEGIDLHHVWQPHEPAGPGRDRRMTVFDEAAAILPDDVIDLSDLFDRTSGVGFADGVHHDERGARLVAEELFERLRESISAAAGRRGSDHG